MNRKQITYKNTTVSFIEEGKGNTIVFLHGFLENATMWETCINIFSKNHRVIAIDLLGHGQTGSIGYIHTMEDMADLVHAVISKLKIRKITLIGHSMGGYVSLAFAELYPDNVRGIALVASTSKEDDANRKINRDRSIELVKKDSDTFINMSITNLFQENTRELYSKEIKSIKEEALKTSKQGIIAALEGMKIRPDREVILHLAQYPILFIFGKTDSVIPYNQAILQTEGTDVKTTVLPGGHMLHIENNKELIKSLSDFFKSNKL